MRDFIFIIGTSGVGKSTLAHGLLGHYKSVCVEQHMIPEFISRDGSEEMTGVLEELTCWENQKALLLCFHKLGYKNPGRAPIPNEYIIDISGLTIKQVFEKAIEIIENSETLLHYAYEKPDKSCFYSWVFDNGLR